MENTYKNCSKCGLPKPLLGFYKLAKSKDGHRPSCKQCDKDARDMVKVKLHDMAYGILKRTNPENQFGKNANYKGIECRIGETHREVYEYLYSNFKEDVENLVKEGKSPSVDRIESSKHYEHGNLRVIDFETNYLLGLANAVKKTSKKIIAIYPDGKREEFNSISHAHRELGCKRDTIIKYIKTGEQVKGSHNGLTSNIVGIRFERK